MFTSFSCSISICGKLATWLQGYMYYVTVHYLVGRCVHALYHRHVYTLSLSLSLSLSHPQGIGLNAQGFANAILFCAFTKQVREQLMNSSAMTWLRLKLCCKRKLVGDEHRFITSYSVRDETVQVLIKNGRTNYGSSSMGDDQLTLTE